MGTLLQYRKGQETTYYKQFNQKKNKSKTTEKHLSIFEFSSYIGDENWPCPAVAIVAAVTAD